MLLYPTTLRRSLGAGAKPDPHFHFGPRSRKCGGPGSGEAAGPKLRVKVT